MYTSFDPRRDLNFLMLSNKIFEDPCETSTVIRITPTDGAGTVSDESLHFVVDRSTRGIVLQKQPDPVRQQR